MKNDDSAFHYSRVDLFPQLEALETSCYHGTGVILSLCAYQSVFTYHVGHRYSHYRALRKPTRSPELVTFVYYKAEFAHIFVYHLRLEIS